MIRIFTLLALLIAIAAVVFALQNSTPILVQFLGWRTEESMALVLLLTFTLGVLFGLFISLPAIIKGMRKASFLNRKVDEKNYEVETLNQKLRELADKLRESPRNQTDSLPETTPLDYKSDTPM